MPSPEICIIAAMAKNRVIGKDGKVPWHISADLRRFKELTTPHPIIMGRKTFEGIGKALPGRTNIVITRSKNFEAEHCLITYSLMEAIQIARQKDTERIFIIGGGQVYDQSISLVNRLYLTVVEGYFDGDTYFPDYSDFSKVVSAQGRESEGLRYKFLELERNII